MQTSMESRWFATLVEDIQKVKADASEASVLDDIITFRRGVVFEDAVFESQYPNESTIQKWPSQNGACDIRNADLLLSFISWARHHYGPIESVVYEDLNERINAVASYWSGKSNILTVMARDFARRGARKIPKKENIWDAQSRHISGKYSGFYVMLRYSSDKKVRAELFCIQRIEASEGTRTGESLERRVLKTQHQGVIRVLWGCEGDFWCGDLIIGRDKFAGVALRWDTAKLPDPVTISLLRHKEERFQTSGPNISFSQRPVLTGMIVGWNSLNSNEIFRCICAVEKLKSNIEPNVENFRKLLASDHCKNFLSSIGSDSSTWEGKSELEAMFSDRKQRLHRRACQEVLAKTSIFQSVDLASWLAH